METQTSKRLSGLTKVKVKRKEKKTPKLGVWESGGKKMGGKREEKGKK